MPSVPSAQEIAPNEQAMELEEANKELDGIPNDSPNDLEDDEAFSKDFGPWLIPQMRRFGGQDNCGCGWNPNSRDPHQDDSCDLDTWHTVVKSTKEMAKSSSMLAICWSRSSC